MQKRSAKILSIVALVFMGVFTVSLIIFFINPKNLTVTIITMVSGIIGVLLYVIVRFMTREKKYIVTGSGEEPDSPPEEPAEEQAEESPGKQPDEKNDPSKPGSPQRK